MGGPYSSTHGDWAEAQLMRLKAEWVSVSAQQLGWDEQAELHYESFLLLSHEINMINPNWKVLEKYH